MKREKIENYGFMLGCSYGNALRLAEAPGDRAVLVDGARALATRFDPRVDLTKEILRKCD